jgi:hypothetical protein
MATDTCLISFTLCFAFLYLKQQRFKYNIAGKDAQSSLFSKKKQSFYRNYADEYFFYFEAVRL